MLPVAYLSASRSADLSADWNASGLVQGRVHQVAVAWRLRGSGWAAIQTTGSRESPVGYPGQTL
jgi:hypothetical protein